MLSAVIENVGSQQPLLFFLDGLDMRWRSLATVAEQVEAGRRALAALELPAGAVVAFTWRAGPDSVAADLAIRAGGWTALPLGPEAEAPVAAGVKSARPDPRSADARLLLPFEPHEPHEPEPPGDASRTARLPPAATELSGRRDRGVLEVPLPTPAELSGEALVCSEAAGEPCWRAWSPAEIAHRVGRLAATLEGDGGGQRDARERQPSHRKEARRPVVVACLDPATPDGRTVLDWALTAGAALVLEPDAWALGGIAGWCRPTVVAGDGRGMASVAAEIRRREARSPWAARWRGWLRRLGRDLSRSRGRGRDRAPGRSSARARPPKPPFGRLRTGIVLGGAGSAGAPPFGAPSGCVGGRLGADDLLLFARYGVRLVTADA